MDNRLVKQNGMLTGVCGGLAAYLKIDPTLVRLVFVLLAMPGGLPGVIPYLLLWLIMPSK